MQEFFERLLQERDDLKRKIISLDYFIKVAPRYAALNTRHKSLLCNQLSVMKIYLSILEARIEDIANSGESEDKKCQ